MNTFSLKVLAANNPFFQGEVVSLVVPTPQGQYGILAHHSNLISAISKGKIIIKDNNEQEIIAIVSDGMVKVEANDVVVLVETAYSPKDFETYLMEKEDKQKTEADIQRKSMNDYMMAQARISRAMYKLSNKKHDDID